MNPLPELPKELVETIRNGRCAAFVGAGLSISSGLPTWNALLTGLIEDALDRKYITKEKRDEFLHVVSNPAKYLMLAQMLSDEYGEDILKKTIVRIFKKANPKFTPVHRLLTEISFKFVVTTNYDELIEDAYHPKLGHSPDVYTHLNTSDFADALWRGDFFVLKAHGEIGNSESIVLTERDYRSIIYRTPGYRALLTAIVATKTLFFIGASLTDPEIQLLLQQLHDAFQGSGQEHFALVSSKDFNESETRHWRKNFNIRCIRYDPSPGHPEVMGFLEAIKKRLVPTPTKPSAPAQKKRPAPASPASSSKRPAPRKRP